MHQLLSKCGLNLIAIEIILPFIVYFLFLIFVLQVLDHEIITSYVSLTDQILVHESFISLVSALDHLFVGGIEGLLLYEV